MFNIIKKNTLNINEKSFFIQLNSLSLIISNKEKVMKKFESFESSVKAMEIARIFGSKSMQTSHYIVIDNVLVRISNHYPVLSNLEAYNDIENLKGILFVFTGENPEKFENKIENDSDFADMYVDTFCVNNEDEDVDYIQMMISRKIQNFQ
jgi:hypothetical protein